MHFAPLVLVFPVCSVQPYRLGSLHNERLHFHLRFFGQFGFLPSLPSHSTLKLAPLLVVWVLMQQELTSLCVEPEGLCFPHYRGLRSSRPAVSVDPHDLPAAEHCRHAFAFSSQMSPCMLCAEGADCSSCAETEAAGPWLNISRTLLAASAVSVSWLLFAHGKPLLIPRSGLSCSNHAAHQLFKLPSSSHIQIHTADTNTIPNTGPVVPEQSNKKKRSKSQINKPVKENWNLQDLCYSVPLTGFAPAVSYGLSSSDFDRLTSSSGQASVAILLFLSGVTSAPFQAEHSYSSKVIVWSVLVALLLLQCAAVFVDVLAGVVFMLPRVPLWLLSARQRLARSAVAFSHTGLKAKTKMWSVPCPQNARRCALLPESVCGW